MPPTVEEEKDMTSPTAQTVPVMNANGVEAPETEPRLAPAGPVDPVRDLVVCGAGPCGMTAAIYAQRSGLSTLLLEGRFPGGQLNLATGIENVPGFPEPVAGIDLAFRMEEQVRRLGVELQSKNVAGIASVGGRPLLWKVTLSDGSSVLARTVIVATGASPRSLGLPGEGELTGSGISYCSTCDGGFFKGRDVAVVGGGSTAVEDAIYLARLCRTVTLIHRRDSLRAEKVLQDQLLAIPNVSVLWNTVITALRSDGSLTGLDLLDRKTGETSFLAVPGLFVAVGQDPGSVPFQDLLDVDDNGYIVADELLHTKQPGIFAAGDVRTTRLRQVVTAMSDGAVAATEAARYLNMDPVPHA